MNKRLLGSLIGIVSIVCLSTCTYASSEPTVTFDTTTQKFVISNGEDEDFGDNFKKMVPGNERIQNFILENTDEREMKFYFNIDVSKDVSEACVGAVYNVELACNGEKFYEGVLGGEKGRLVDLSSGALSENILMATLGKDEKTNISVKIKFDGETTDNSYQNQEAEFKIKFGVSYDDVTIIEEEDVPEAPAPTIIDKVTSVVNPKTGDSTSLVIWSILLFSTVGGMIILSIRKDTIWNDKTEYEGSKINSKRK